MCRNVVRTRRTDARTRYLSHLSASDDQISLFLASFEPFARPIGAAAFLVVHRRSFQDLGNMDIQYSISAFFCSSGCILAITNPSLDIFILLSMLKFVCFRCQPKCHATTFQNLPFFLGEELLELPYSQKKKIISHFARALT